MVARINSTRKLSKAINYNEKKVAQNRAELIAARNFLQDKNRLTYDEKLARFQRLNELDPRSKVNTLHITLNFHPAEQLSHQELTTISDRYMQGLGMDQQPYLVYRHHDASHPHVHIVTSLITPQGIRIDTNYMGKRLSEPTRKAIEREFLLIPAGSKNLSKEQQATTQLISGAIQHVNRHYSFTTLGEYNALLRHHQVSATATKKFGGLYYNSIDEKGYKNSPPIMSAQLPGPYGMRQLQKKFEEGKQLRQAHLPSIRQRIDWALTQHPDSLRDFADQVRQDGIDLVVHRRGDEQPYGLTYIDHQTRTAINGGSLGKAYTAGTILRNLPQELTPSKKQHQAPTGKTQTNNQKNDNDPLGPILRSASLNPSAPVYLSQLFEATPTPGSSFNLDEEQKIRRHKPRL